MCVFVFDFESARIGRRFVCILYMRYVLFKIQLQRRLVGPIVPHKNRMIGPSNGLDDWSRQISFSTGPIVLPQLGTNRPVFLTDD